MHHPRLVALVSAAAASAVAFSVASHWRLLGTLTGAALVPVIYTLVSHWSSAGLEGAGRWVRRRLGSRCPDKEGGVAGESSGATESDPGSTGRRSGAAPAADRRATVPWSTRRHRAFDPQWLLVGSAVLALAVSVYTLAAVPPDQTGEKVRVERVVAEKTVTVTTTHQGPPTDATGASSPAAEAPSPDASPASDPAPQPAENDDAGRTVPDSGDPQERPSESELVPTSASVVPGLEDGTTVSTTPTSVTATRPGGGEDPPSAPSSTQPSPVDAP